MKDDSILIVLIISCNMYKCSICKLSKEGILYVLRRIRRVVYTEGMTPLPTTVMTILFLVMFFGDMTNTMCFSYLPKMVKSFGTSEVETGHYAGLIATSVYVGYVLCSVFWGYVGDTIGNKITLLITLVGLTIATFIFGFSTSFYWALLSRLSQGLFLGFNVVAKSILAKATDETNVSLAFSIYFTFWTMASTIGPSLGGFLVFPAEQYPGAFSKDSLFGRFGTLLPNLVIVSCLVITILIVIIFLPNDGKKRHKRSELIPLLKSVSSNHYTEERATTSYDNKRSAISYNQPLPYNEKNVKTIPNGIDLAQTCTLVRRPSKLIPKGVRTVLTLFRCKNYVVCLCLYALSGFAIIGVEEMFSLLAATSKQYNGLGLTTSEIGIVLLCSSALLLGIQISVMSKICKHFGPLWTFIVCSLFLTFTVPMIPTTSALPYKTGKMTFAVFVMMTCMVLMNGIYITINVLINNNVTPELYGSANGIAWTASCLGRLFAARIFGDIYSWSLTNVKGVAGNDKALGFPFNQFFVFFVAALSFLATSAIAGFGLSRNVSNAVIHVEDISDRTDCAINGKVPIERDK